MPGGLLAPVSDAEAARMVRYANGEQWTVEIKQARNPDFHRKVFKFLTFCFEHWASDRVFMDEVGQFDCFRKNLTVLAGYSEKYYSIRGAVRVEAKSLSYGNMDQQEFEIFYSALISAALQHLFFKVDPGIEEKLYTFF